MPVAFDPLIIEPVDRRALHEEIATALKSESTRIFIDTNVLMWTYSLHQGARTDLCDWLTSGPQAGRIHIPRSAIHEFSTHRGNNAKLYPFGQEFKPLDRLLERFEYMAPLVADDKWAADNGFTDRETYLAQVAQAHETISRLVKPITKGENISKLHQELIPVFNMLALDTDVFSRLPLLRDAYEARSEFRVPPGYKDAKKGQGSESTNLAAGAPAKAGANRFGDLAIWDEILEFVPSIELPIETVIIITHDNKLDWSYFPQQIIDSDGNTKPNPSGPAQLSVAQPMLVHELQKRTDATALYIISIPQLAVIASANDVGFKFGQLAKAVQVEDLEEEEASNEVEDDVGEENTEPPVLPGQEVPAGDQALINNEEDAGAVAPAAGDIDAFLAQPPEVALADANYILDVAGVPAFETVIQRLKSHNWYLQNPAVHEGITLLSQGKASLLQAFIFGRNLYQAAVGTAADAMRALEEMPQRLDQVSESLSNAVYAGALFELYFDGQGALRHDLKDEQIGPLLRHQSTETYAPAILFIRAKLEEAHARLLIMPSTQPIVLQLDIIKNDDDAISAIMLGDIALTRTKEGGNIEASTLPAMTSFRKLRSLVSANFSVPEYQLNLVPAFDDVQNIADLQFVQWNPVDGPDLMPA